ncbi:MAG TPA: hypothetical protein VGJ21_00445 [Terracidiphilus sp.]|jgi:hypothetical protein
MRGILRVGVWVAAAVSLGCTLYAGRHNSSVFLMGLFGVWVLSPFFGIVWMDRVSERSPRDLAAAARASSIVICITSLGLYVTVAAIPAGRHTAFAFLVVPACSWLAIVSMLIASRLARRRMGR